MAPEQKQQQLSVIQKWMQSVITNPSGVEAGIESPDSQQLISVSTDQVEQVITPSQARTSLQRLQVYGNAYYARLLDCLRSFFPALCNTLGEELFDSFSIQYLQQHPSQSYTLHRLADHFVEFLKSTRPTSASKNEPTWEDFLIELATFEWQIDQVFDGPGHEKMSILSTQALANIDPQEWGNSQLQTTPSLVLLEFEFPINRFYTQFKKEEELLPPAPERSYIALARIDYVVRRIPQSELQFRLLQQLQQGKTVNQAIEQIAQNCENLDDLLKNLHIWFQQFAQEQLFVTYQVNKEI